jgi:hypothetical protein
MKLVRTAAIHVAHLQDAAALNRRICAAFARCRDDAELRRTHFFAGRYENLYIGLDRVPDAAAVLQRAQECAQRILAHPGPLRLGFWFNAMGPGQATLPHSHDDDDELLSGVYYLRIPPGSGQLVLHEGPVCTRIAPQEGMFVFFPPWLAHEVTPNEGTQERLSMAINVGPAA